MASPSNQNSNSLQYVNIDYSTYKAQLLQRIRSHWLLSWNDFLANNFGQILVDLIAWSTTTLAYLLNRVAAENFLSTMTLRESAVRLGNLVSYQLPNPTSATVLCEAVLSSPATSPISLFAGTAIQIQTLNSGTQVFQLTKNYTIETGAVSPAQVVLTINPTATGNNVLNTTFAVTNGSENVTLNDTTVDLTKYLAVGQTFTQPGNSQQYTIANIQLGTNSESNNQLVLNIPWQQATGYINAIILEQRIEFSQGQSVTDETTTPSTQQPNYLISLSQQPVVEGSIQVSINGNNWNIVNTLALSDATDQVVQILNQVDGSSAVIFGDGTFGAMPPANETVTVNYVVGGGSAGNISIGSVNTTIVGYQNNNQITVQLTNNSAPGEGGQDAETLAQAVQNIPPFIRSNDRAVTLGDYEILSSTFNDPINGSVTYATAFSNSTNSLLEGNVISIYAWTSGPSGGLIPVSSALANSLKNYLQTKSIGTDYITILEGTTIPAPISVIFSTATGYDVTSVQESIESEISQIISQLTPGSSIIFSNLISQLNSIPGVSSLVIATPLSNIQPLSSSQIFIDPDDSYQYQISLNNVIQFTYQGQLPITPLAAWNFGLTVNGIAITIVPDAQQGYARLIGDRSLTGLAGYASGLLTNLPATPANASDFYYATDTQQLYRADTAAQNNNSTLFWNPVSIGGSYVNLNTGELIISFTGTQNPVEFNLITAQGYSSILTVNLYISYTGNTTQLARNQIRSALITWANGFQPGGSIFSQPVVGSNGEILIPSSQSNVTGVVLNVTGVTGVTNVSLGSINNGISRIDASANQMIKLGTITLNNNVN